MKNKNFFKISFIYFTAMISIAVLFVLGYFGIIQNEFLSSFLIQIVVMFAIPMLMYTALVSKNFKTTFKDAGFKKLTTKMLFISIVLGVVLYFINSFVANFFYSIISLFGYENLSSAQNVNLNYSFLFKELVLSCILPGFCEEFLHRGILLHCGKKTAKPRYCLIISSILFGLMHLNIQQFFYASILGFLMGYVSLASDSIYPCIIIHFTNNFLSSYFYYGAKLNWPLATFVSNLEMALLSNFFLFAVTSLAFVGLLIHLYIHLTKKLVVERAKRDMTTVVKEIGILNIPIEQAQERLDQINYILKNSNSAKTVIGTNDIKLSLLEKAFIISSLILGALITICSFIWGII
ncbi:MAG: CPBP family intramembrane metalloprotease [Clostridia bacterium]|nr:CPBP family intramembrane metalloprotease [Clostridia bacterium]